MKIGSLFSGYSGLDRAVMEVYPRAAPAWFVEFDPAPSKILAHHYSHVPNFGDVTEVDWAAVEPVDVLTAGYPCQPFSLAGKRKGTNDERHLWPHVLDAVRVLRPQFAFFENVRGHLTLGLDAVLADLASIGFDAEWAIIRASDAGAPHVRERLFVLAYPHGQRLETQRPPGRQGKKVTGAAYRLGSFRGVSSPAHFVRECQLRWGDAGLAVARWALKVGRLSLSLSKSPI